MTGTAAGGVIPFDGTDLEVFDFSATFTFDLFVIGSASGECALRAGRTYRAENVRPTSAGEDTYEVSVNEFSEQ